MKSERRHELLQNELLDWLNKVTARIQPYGKYILAAGLVVAAGFFISTWWRRQSATDTANGWDSLYTQMLSGQPAELERVAEQYAGEEVSHWARLAAGDMYLSIGCRELFTDKATAVNDLQKAIANYTEVLAESDEATLKERASFGLARSYESMAGTKESGKEALDKATAEYQRLVDDWPEGVYRQLASRRLDDLNRRQTREFFDAFAQFDPKPLFSPGELGDGPVFDPSNVPDDDTVPQYPQLDLTGSAGLSPGEDSQPVSSPQEPDAGPLSTTPQAEPTGAETGPSESPAQPTAPSLDDGAQVDSPVMVPDAGASEPEEPGSQPEQPEQPAPEAEPEEAAPEQEVAEPPPAEQSGVPTEPEAAAPEASPDSAPAPAGPGPSG